MMVIDWLAVAAAIFGVFLGFILGAAWVTYAVPIEEHDNHDSH
jgi:hypothetical protein